MAQICAKDKQKHFDIRIKASSQFLDARFVSWVFYLGKVLWHFVSEAGANFPGRKKKIGCESWARHNLRIFCVNRQLEDAALPEHSDIKRFVRSLRYCCSIHTVKDILSVDFAVQIHRTKAFGEFLGGPAHHQVWKANGTANAQLVGVAGCPVPGVLVKRKLNWLNLQGILSRFRKQITSWLQT